MDKEIEILDGDEPIEYQDVNLNTITAGVTPPTTDLSNMEGFENDIGILNDIIKIRSDFVRNISQQFINGAIMNPKDLEAVNSVMSQLSSDILAKVKLIKDSSLQEAKNNNDAQFAQLALSLMGNRSKELTVLREAIENKQVDVDADTDQLLNELEVKELNNFEILPTELDENKE